jgi:two-component system LytT family response regulator
MSKPTAITTIIVDDEELARRGIELRLADHPDFKVIAHCSNGR